MGRFPAGLVGRSEGGLGKSSPEKLEDAAAWMWVTADWLNGSIFTQLVPGGSPGSTSCSPLRDPSSIALEDELCPSTPLSQVKQPDSPD